MNIAHKKPHYFQITRTAEDTINVNSGMIRLSDPRMYKVVSTERDAIVDPDSHYLEFSPGTPVVSMPLLGYGYFSNPDIFKSLDIYDTTISGISGDCNVYLKITPWIMMPIDDRTDGVFPDLTYDDPMMLGDDTGEAYTTDFSSSWGGYPLFKDYQLNRARNAWDGFDQSNLINRRFSYVAQAEDPEDDSHDASKNFDTISFVDGYVSGACQTHILIAEITFRGDSMIINQRHRGPLSLSLPKIYWGDFDHRPNIA